MDESRRIILQRRARFLAAALAGLSSPLAGCEPPARGPAEPAPPAVVPVASADAPEPSATLSPEPSPPLADLDADRDGIADAYDACPRAPGTASADPKKHGCPCLSIVSTRPPVWAELSFALQGDQLQPEMFRLLDEVALGLVKMPELQVTIEGHTSREEPDALGLKRARAVEVYLLRRGVPAAQIRMVNQGHGKPRFRDDTDERRRANRRVELRISEP